MKPDTCKRLADARVHAKSIQRHDSGAAEGFTVALPRPGTLLIRLRGSGEQRLTQAGDSPFACRSERDLGRDRRDRSDSGEALKWFDNTAAWTRLSRISFELPVSWVAIPIHRCCTDVRKTSLGHPVTTRTLGET